MKIMANNKKIHHDYNIEEKLECGIVLQGSEVKSIRDSKVSIKEAWCNIVDGELFINGMHVAKWGNSNEYFNHEETRVRKILASKKEILALECKVKEKGMTLLPSKIYLSNNRIKVEVCLCKGLHNYDKRQKIKDKTDKRNMERAMKNKI